MDEQIRVLLVDDERSFLQPYAKWLQGRGFIVETAESGPEALEKAQATEGAFDVAVIDQIMGPPNGIEIMRRLQQDYPIEAIILTAFGDQETGKWAMDLGAYRYMGKPCDKDELAISIRVAARFGHERQRRIAQQILVEAGQKMGMASTIEELYENLYQAAQKLVPQLDAFLIARRRESDGTVSFPYCYIRKQKATLAERKGHKGLAEYVMDTRSPLLLPDGDKPFREQHNLATPHQALGYCTSEIVSPLLLGERVLGSLHVMTFDPAIRYTQAHLEVLLALANQAAVAIQNVEQLDMARRLQEASSALAVCRGKDNVLKTIVHEAHALADSDFTGMILQDRDGTLRRGPREEPQGWSRCMEEPRQENGLTRAIIAEGKPRVIGDVQADPLVKDDVKKANIRSLLGVPLIHADRVLGVLYVHTLQPRHFSQHDIDLLTTFAAQAAAALHTAQDEEQDVERLRSIVTVLQDYHQRHDTKAIADRIAATVCTVLNVDVCTVLEYDANSAAFAARGVAGLRQNHQTPYSIRGCI